MSRDATAPFKDTRSSQQILFSRHLFALQVTLGNYVVKDNARKVRRLQNGNVLTGFAGAAVDAITLFERLEGKLEQYPQVLLPYHATAPNLS